MLTKDDVCVELVENCDDKKVGVRVFKIGDNARLNPTVSEYDLLDYGFIEIRPEIVVNQNEICQFLAPSKFSSRGVDRVAVEYRNWNWTITRQSMRNSSKDSTQADCHAVIKLLEDNDVYVPDEALLQQALSPSFLVGSIDDHAEARLDLAGWKLMGAGYEKTDSEGNWLPRELECWLLTDNVHWLLVYDFRDVVHPDEPPMQYEIVEEGYAADWFLRQGFQPPDSILASASIPVLQAGGPVEKTAAVKPIEPTKSSDQVDEANREPDLSNDERFRRYRLDLDDPDFELPPQYDDKITFAVDRKLDELKPCNTWPDTIDKLELAAMENNWGAVPRTEQWLRPRLERYRNAVGITHVPGERGNPKLRAKSKQKRGTKTNRKPKPKA